MIVNGKYIDDNNLSFEMINVINAVNNGLDDTYYMVFNNYLTNPDYINYDVLVNIFEELSNRKFFIFN